MTWFWIAGLPLLAALLILNACDTPLSANVL
jgi:hypothetical protein